MRSYVWLLPASNSDDRQRKWRRRPTHFQKLSPFWTAFNLITKSYPKRLTCRGRKIKKYQRCSLSWFCRLSAKNSLPVFIFVSTTTWNEKRERKNKKHSFFELETCERTGFSFIRPPGTPFNSMQYSAMVRYDGKHCLTNICEYFFSSCCVARM